jgi:hypothetical protein
MSTNVEYVSLTDSLLVSAGSVNYLAIRDSDATPAPQLAGLGSVNLGNNNGWDFSNIPGYGIAFFSVAGALNYLDISDCNATPAPQLAGTGSVNSGNNSGWDFTTSDGNNENWVIVNTLVTGLDYLYIEDSAATPPYWWAGNYSVNGGNNTGWLFYANLALTENAAIADTESEQFFYTSTAVEGFTTFDAQETQTNFNAAIIEDSELVDIETTANSVFNSAIVEPVTLFAIQTTANSVFNSAIVEPTTLADIQARNTTLFSSVVENAVYASTQAAQANFNSIALENCSVLDIVGTNANIFNSSILENIVVVDGQIHRGWFKINDTQTPNWTQVNNYQG